MCSFGMSIPVLLILAAMRPYGAVAQSDSEGQDGQGRENLIPSLPLPSWISPDLTSFPNNIPRGDTWQPRMYPSNQQGKGSFSCIIYSYS